MCLIMAPPVSIKRLHSYFTDLCEGIVEVSFRLPIEWFTVYVGNKGERLDCGRYVSNGRVSNEIIYFEFINCAASLGTSDELGRTFAAGLPGPQIFSGSWDTKTPNNPDKQREMKTLKLKLSLVAARCRKSAFLSFV